MSERLAIFASGRGSNAEKIIQHFQSHDDLGVGLIISNRSQAGVFDIAQKYGIPHSIYNNRRSEEHLIEELRTHRITWIALAGYLKKITPDLISAYPNKMVNIHPALLPKYGGPGMYGHYVHVAVSEAGDAQSGMTIHYVNEQYDEGEIIFQATCDIEPYSDADKIAQEVLKLEHRYYPRILETLMRGEIYQTR